MFERRAGNGAPVVSPLPLVNAASTRAPAQFLADGTGAGYLVWTDFRSGTPETYCLRVNGSGSPTFGWDGLGGGNLLSLPGISAFSPRTALDGTGGAIVAWVDQRNGVPDIFATRVTAAGTRSPGWSASGNAAAVAYGFQDTPEVIADGQGGAYLFWSDERGVTFSSSELFGTHLLSNGSLAAHWSVNGQQAVGIGLPLDGAKVRFLPGQVAVHGWLSGVSVTRASPTASVPPGSCVPVASSRPS